MEIDVTVTQSEYREILIWIGEGGAPRNVNYRVIPDSITEMSGTSMNPIDENGDGTEQA